jgi:archaellum component FlaC
MEERQTIYAPECHNDTEGSINLSDVVRDLQSLKAEHAKTRFVVDVIREELGFKSTDDMGKDRVSNLEKQVTELNNRVLDLEKRFAEMQCDVQNILDYERKTYIESEMIKKTVTDLKHTIDKAKAAVGKVY